MFKNSQVVLVVKNPPARGSVVACCRVGALSAAVPAWDLLKQIAIILITSTVVWPQVK